MNRKGFIVVVIALLCVLLSGCDLFRSEPKVQNPPPSDRNYIGFLVNGQVETFKESLYPLPSGSGGHRSMTVTISPDSVYISFSWEQYKTPKELNKTRRISIYTRLPKDSIELNRWYKISRGYWFDLPYDMIPSQEILDQLMLPGGEIRFTKMDLNDPHEPWSGEFHFSCKKVLNLLPVDLTSPKAFSTVYVYHK